MEEEFSSLKYQNIWSIVPLPSTRKALKTKSVYDIQYDGQDRLIRHKPRLFSKGFSQKSGVDYFWVCAPVCRYTTARFLIALSLHHDWNRVQLDVKMAFLNAELDEEIYS